MRHYKKTLQAAAWRKRARPARRDTVSGFSPESATKAPGPLRFQALKTHGGVTRGIKEAGKMGMIAFYAGLCVGMLLGVLLLSLWAFFLARPESGALPDPAEGFPQINLLEP